MSFWKILRCRDLIFCNWFIVNKEIFLLLTPSKRSFDSYVSCKTATSINRSLETISSCNSNYESLILIKLKRILSITSINLNCVTRFNGLNNISTDNINCTSSTIEKNKAGIANFWRFNKSNIRTTIKLISNARFLKNII